MVKCAALLLCSGILMAQPAADPAATARKALDLLIGGKYAEMPPIFTPEMKKDLPEAELAKLGPRVQSFGALSKIDDPQVTRAGANTVVVFPAHFANQNINFRFMVTANGLIGGMFLLP